MAETARSTPLPQEEALMDETFNDNDTYHNHHRTSQAVHRISKPTHGALSTSKEAVLLRQTFNDQHA
jgi:hypothetical protein